MPWTLVFDLDGTLVDTAPDLAAATNHVMGHAGLQPVANGDIRPFVGHGALAMIEAAAAHQGRHFSETELHDLFKVFLSYYEANIANDSRPFDGVIEALQGYRERGILLAVCTNKVEALARELLDTLDMSQYFAALAGRDTFPVYKPDPRHLTGTIKRAGGDPRRAIMVGDTDTDISAAKAANIPVIAVDFGYSPTPVAVFAPDIVIGHYSELGLAVESLFALGD